MKNAGENNLSKISIAILVVLLLSCSKPKEVTLQSEGKAHKLVYSCTEAKPQAESAEDIKTLFRYLPALVKDLVDQKRIITLQSLSIATEISNIRAIEMMVVKHACERKYGYKSEA